MHTRLATQLIILITLLASAGLITFLGLPSYHHLQALRGQTDSLTSQIAKFDSRRAELARLATDKIINQIYADRLNQILPEQANADQLTLLVDQGGHSLQLALPNLSIKATAPSPPAGLKPLPPGISGLDLSLEAVGQFGGLVDFLQELEQGNRLIGLRTVVLSGRDDGQVELHLEGTAFWKKTPVLTETNLSPVDPARRSQILSHDITTLPDLTSIPLGRPDPFAPLE